MFKFSLRRILISIGLFSVVLGYASGCLRNVHGGYAIDFTPFIRSFAIVIAGIGASVGMLFNSWGIRVLSATLLLLMIVFDLCS
ncbi:MAG: hypothetical protein K8U03_10735 [Planctomycetia bacterium]|nr:hypothetical protein [Planctomycetia bacterium]